MKPPDRTGYRLWLAVAVLILALFAGWWANRDTEPAPPPRSLPPAPADIPAPPPAKTLPPVQHAAAENAAPPVDIFAVHTWEPPPPPVAAAAPAVAQAPPLPFRFMGRIAEPGKAPVFLLVQGDRVLPVKAGERIGAAYRLEKFEGGKLFFRYQPMNLVQTLPVGGPQ
jgi:hypothetical protein